MAHRRCDARGCVPRAGLHLTVSSSAGSTGTGRRRGRPSLPDDRGRAAGRDKEKTGRPLPLVLLNACPGNEATGSDRQLRRKTAARRRSGGIGDPELQIVSDPLCDPRRGWILSVPWRHGEDLQPSRALAGMRKSKSKKGAGPPCSAGRPPRRTPTGIRPRGSVPLPAPTDQLEQHGGDREPLRAPPVHVVGERKGPAGFPVRRTRSSQRRELRKAFADVSSSGANEGRRRAEPGIHKVGRRSSVPSPGRASCLTSTKQGRTVPQTEGKIERDRESRSKSAARCLWRSGRPTSPWP